MNRKPTVKADVEVAHNYSTQTLNSTELAKEKLRQILAKVSKLIVKVKVAHNYSKQTLNLTELAKEKLRQIFTKVRSVCQ